MLVHGGGPVASAEQPDYSDQMPFKHNAARRHRVPKQLWRVTNWPAYEAGLRRRGDLTFWLDETAVAGWQAPRRSTPGGQPQYSDLAIELALTRRLVFHLALRQAKAFSAIVLRLLGLELAVGVGAWRRPGSLEPSSPAMSLACRSSTIPPAVTASQGSAGG